MVELAAKFVHHKIGIMARRTVRISLYKDKPEKFVDLLKSVLKQHENMGAASPLNDPSIIDMVLYKQRLEQAVLLREESEELRALAEAKMNEANVLFGRAPGQNINTPNTLYNLLETIKMFLKTRHMGEEESLSPFGFNVVVGTAKYAGRKKKTETGK